MGLSRLALTGYPPGIPTGRIAWARRCRTRLALIDPRSVSPRFIRCLALLVFFVTCVAGRSLFAEKPEKWLEVRSPHFVLVTNGSTKTARRVAFQFEMIRAVFQNTFPNTRVDPAQPPIILAVKDEADLKVLLPEFWEKKRQLHPAGVFVGGAEKNYVVLRLDASVPTGYEGMLENPYHLIYHEYVHLLVSLNFPWVPVWLNEGMAEFYGNTIVRQKQVDCGVLIPSHAGLLRQGRFMPLPLLFAVDSTSPYYNEENNATIFYAESWALTHFLILGEQGKHSRQLVEYIELLRRDVDPVAAAKRALGDLNELQRKLDLYMNGLTMPAVGVKPPAEIDESNFVVCELPPAESAAVRGDFYVYDRHLAAGRALLEEAMRLEPNLASAYESLGFLCFREGKKEEAAKFFDQAVKLDSRNYLAHYYHAMLSVEQSSGAALSEGVASDLKRTIELNPNFAPAYAALASVYGARGQSLEEARTLAAKAIELEPGNLHYHLALAHVLLRQEHPEEAATVARRVLAAAKTPEERAGAESLLAAAQRYLDYQAEVKRRAEQARAAEEQARAWRDRRERVLAERPSEAGGEAQIVRKAERLPADRPTPAEGLRIAAEGRIIEVSCTLKGGLKLTLARPAYNLELHAANYRQTKLVTAEGNAPEGFNPCRQLKGMQVRITYKAGAADAGEIVSIELLK